MSNTTIIKQKERSMVCVAGMASNLHRAVAINDEQGRKISVACLRMAGATQEQIDAIEAGNYGIAGEDVKCYEC